MRTGQCWSHRPWGQCCRLPLCCHCPVTLHGCAGTAVALGAARWGSFPSLGTAAALGTVPSLWTGGGSSPVGSSEVLGMGRGQGGWSWVVLSTLG